MFVFVVNKLSRAFSASPRDATTSSRARQWITEGRKKPTASSKPGHAVFTTSDYEETAMGSYGSEVFEIDMAKMAADGYRPYVALEPSVVEWELRRSLASMISYEEYEPEYSRDMSNSTVIVYGAIPPQYLTRLES